MGSRRGHHEGTIRKRSDDRWEAMVSLPDGERKSLYGKTRGEVVAKMRGIHEGLAKGIMPGKDSVLLRDYVERWLEGVKLSVEFTTWRRYRNHVRCLLDYLGSRRLSKLSVDDLRSMHANLLEAGYAAQTIHVLHSILHSILHHALQDAMAEGLVGRNVAQVANRPKPQPETLHP